MLKKMEEIYKKNEEIINYLLVGVCTTFVSLLTYYFCVFTVLEPDIPLELQLANVISSTVGIIFAYFTNRKFVFKSKEKNKIKEATKFVSSRLSTMFLDMIIMFIGVTVLKFNDKILKIVSQVLVIVLNYILSKLFVFKKR